jgi:hypothetical protein
MTAADLYAPYTAAGTPRSSFTYNGGATRRAYLVYVRYINDPLTERAPTADEIRTLAEYCEYWIGAPCWVFPADDLRLLRLSILRVTTAEQLAGWLWGVASIGLGNVLGGGI